MIRNQLAFAQLPPVARRRGAFAFGLALCTLGLSFSASAQSIFTTFDVPGSVQTIPISINSKGGGNRTIYRPEFCGSWLPSIPGRNLHYHRPSGLRIHCCPKHQLGGGRLRDSTTRTLRFTDSFELPMALSPQSTLRAPPFRPSLTVSTRRGRLRDPTSTRRFRRKIYFTDSFELPTE